MTRAGTSGIPLTGASGAVPIFLLKFKRNELCYAYVE
nr:MAG TPA: hypothetical protein [Caudoviricetes sp.]